MILVACALVPCQTQPHPAFRPIPRPSPHTAATVAILQSGDVPAGLNVCPGSGPIDVYLSVLAGADAALASRESDQWQQLGKEGATQGAIAIFAATPAACNADLGATPNVNAMTSFVARFA